MLSTIGAQRHCNEPGNIIRTSLSTAHQPSPLLYYLPAYWLLIMLWYLVACQVAGIIWILQYKSAFSHCLVSYWKVLVWGEEGKPKGKGKLLRLQRVLQRFFWRIIAITNMPLVLCFIFNSNPRSSIIIFINGVRFSSERTNKGVLLGDCFFSLANVAVPNNCIQRREMTVSITGRALSSSPWNHFARQNEHLPNERELQLWLCLPAAARREQNLLQRWKLCRRWKMYGI